MNALDLAHAALAAAEVALDTAHANLRRAKRGSLTFYHCRVGEAVRAVEDARLTLAKLGG